MQHITESDVVALMDGRHWPDYDSQPALWELFGRKLMDRLDEIGAMPSLLLAGTIIDPGLDRFWWRRDRPLRDKTLASLRKMARKELAA